MKTIKNFIKISILLLVAFSFIGIATTSADSGYDVPTIDVQAAGPPFQFGEITTGKNSLYNTVQNRQDLSGAATDGNHIIFADDGGKPSDFNFIRVMSDLPDAGGVNLPLTEFHQDMEGATFSNGFFVATTSLSVATDDDTRRLTRFKVDEGATQLVEESSVDLRDELLAAMQAEFGDEWFNRIKDEPGKSGGLNIEAISRSHTGQDVLLWGIRSPMFGDDFGNPATNPALSLAEGEAIIAAVHNPFSDNPTFSFETVALESEFGDHGIRGMEWIPAVHGYVIIGGPIPKGDGYSLWRLRQNGQLDQLELPGFDHLCRPESVIQTTEDGKDYLVVISEDSGAACDGVDFTYIKAEIVPGNGNGNGKK